jgi:hypothetical protein
MNYAYDPTISSSAYHALARKRARYHKVPQYLEWMLDWDDFGFGVHKDHVDQLLDPDSWSASVTEDGRKPRVFLDAYVNQKGNVEIRSIGGHYRIYFEDDWHWHFLSETTAGHYGPHRSLGEVMWMRDFDRLYGSVIRNRNPVAKALLFGFKARLDELIRDISARIEVVGAMPMQISYGGKNVTEIDFAPTISNEQIGALQKAAFGWSFFSKPGADGEQ